MKKFERSAAMGPSRKVILALAAGLIGVVAASTGLVAEEAAGAAASQPASPVTMGSKDSAKWTETTTKAATAAANQAVLASGKPATVTGELIDVSCYLQLGKKGEAHAPCGADCIRHGQPAGILSSDGDVTILFVEEHDPRRKGEIDVREKLASLVARQVTASGMLTVAKDGTRALYVQGAAIEAAK
jgi:hypothetical protein